MREKDLKEISQYFEVKRRKNCNKESEKISSLLMLGLLKP